jgi:periplasmic protein TonB
VSADSGDLHLPPGDYMPSSAKENESRIAEAGRTVTPSPAGSSSGESQASRGVAASCEIPLEVHGSQKGGTQYHTVTPFHEETRTVIVFPHGCVLRLSTAVNVGQMLALTNQNTQRGMLSRVTHVRSYPNLKSYVEIEFTQADPDFWSIDFAEEGAAQGYMPPPSAASAPGSTPQDFWSPGTEPALPQTAPSTLASSRSAAKDRGRSIEVVPAYIPVPPPVTAPPEPSSQSTSPATSKKEVLKTTAQPKAPEFSIAPPPQEKAAEEPPSSQAWAELLVMEPQQEQLSAQQLSPTRSDVEESLAPDSSHDAGEVPSFDAENPEPISPSVMKELEKLALEHVAEKHPERPAAGESASQGASGSSPSVRQRTESIAEKKQSETSRSRQSKDSRSTKRPGLLSSLTGGGPTRDAKPSPLHSFTGAPPAGDAKHSPLHSFTPLPSPAESLPGEVHGTNPHKTQSLADQTPDSGEESDFGNFLRDPEPRTASQHVFAGHADGSAPRVVEAHATLAPLRAKKSKSGVVLAALTVALVLIVGWWFYPMRGSVPVSRVVPAASAPSPVDSPSQWPSQSPADAATLDSSSGGRPAAVESGPASSAPAVESKPDPDSGIREVIPVPRSSSKAPATSGGPSHADSRASLPTMTLAAPTSSGKGSASVSAEPPPDLSPADAAKARGNSFPGIVGSSGANVPAPAPAPAVANGATVAGGRVKEPRLISSVSPIYPQAAMQANVQGDVKVQVTIDETGHVTKMKVISGPSLLQRAAMDAVRQWRYEPSVLNEKPIAVEQVITVRFHR